MNNNIKPYIDESAIWDTLSTAQKADTQHVADILQKARLMEGLDASDVAVLSQISDPEQLGELFAAASHVKEEIYGKRLVLFTPMYVSNLCANDCSYCAFRSSNRDIKRSSLSQDEIASETHALVEEGHKRILLVAGEAYPKQGFEYILDAIDTIYSVKSGRGEIRRVNVNVAPLTETEFRSLNEHKIGTYQIFQETYHRETYGRVHTRGKKADYQWRLEAMDRAFNAGINDVGVGILFGLTDWRFEIMALMQHISHLENRFDVGPHTISVPRLEPATGSLLAAHPPRPVSDLQFRKLVAILRLAVPYTGIIMSTRETAEIRRETFALGVSQISAGSRTSPGAYSQADEAAAQFSLGDHRSLDEVVRDVASLGYVPSFCTGCYRLGRTGQDFMDLARPGEIKKHCEPNGLSSFKEYLMNYASDETVRVGNDCIESALGAMEQSAAKRARVMLDKVRSGDRDVFC